MGDECKVSVHDIIVYKQTHAVYVHSARDHAACVCA